jgi:hypothetical protein
MALACMQVFALGGRGPVQADAPAGNAAESGYFAVPQHQGGGERQLDGERGEPEGTPDGARQGRQRLVEAALACMQVFALGGRGPVQADAPAGNAAESGYFAASDIALASAPRTAK